MKNSILAVLIVLFLAVGSYSQSSSIEIWIRAFIPNAQNAGGGTGYITQHGDGISSVKLQNIDPIIPNMCFATDNRGFSLDANVTSRLETRFTLTKSGDGTGSVVPQQARTVAAITKKVDCATGSVLAEKPGTVDRDVIGVPAVSADTVQVIGQVEGRNVLTPAGSLGPAIDYTFDIQWTPKNSTLLTKTSVGSFPAFEMYARQPGGVWTKVVNRLPSGAPWQLGGDAFGLNYSNLVGTVVVPKLSGKWQSSETEHRFALEFTSGNAIWTEKNPAGGSLRRDVPVKDLGNGKYRIERPNDEEVLSFLGFQPKIRFEILARGANPSFITFSVKDDKIEAEWNGVLVIKDAAGNLKDLIQPGVRPAKQYLFLATN